MSKIRLSKKIEKNRRPPGKVATAMTSVRNFCLECVHYQPNEVALCAAPQCWLWPLRFGKYPKADFEVTLSQN